MTHEHDERNGPEHSAEESTKVGNKNSSQGHNHNHLSSVGGRNQSRLYMVLALTGSFLMVEVVGGILTNSLALLADAGHMFTDVVGLIMALVAIKLGEKPAHQEKTFGYYRTEILAALANAVILILVGIYILYEAIQRFSKPPEVLGGGMLVVAILGLLVNLISIFVLRQGSKESLNMKGAYLEVLSDALGSVGVLVAAGIILLTGWGLADPIVGVGIGLFIVPRAFTLLNEAINILLEGTPKGLDMEEVRHSLEILPGVRQVHDLHAWTITSGMNAMSGHVVVDNLECCTDVLTQAQQILHERFEIEHCTIQIEPQEFNEAMETHR